VRLSPGFAEAHYSLGKTLAALNKLDWAVSEYKEALGLDPGLSTAYFDMGIALEESGDLEGAASAYREFIKSRDLEHGVLWEFADRRLSDLEKATASPP